MKFVKLLPLLSLSLLTSCGTLKKLTSYMEVSEDPIISTSRSSRDIGGQESTSSRNTPVKEAKYTVTYKTYHLQEGSTSGQSQCLDILIQIQNTGAADLFLDSGEVNLVDDTGTKMFTNDLTLQYSPTTILPGEYGYFYLSTLESLAMDKTYTIQEKLDVQRAVFTTRRFTTSDVTLKDRQYSSGFDISLTMTNQSQYVETNWTCISVVLFDSSDQPFAVYGSTITDSIAVGEKRNISSPLKNVNVAPSLKVADVHRYEATAYEYKMFNM